MNYSEILQSINNWNGTKLEYWKGVKILEDAGKLSNTEKKIVQAGLSTQSRALLITKIGNLEIECEAELAKQNYKSNTAKEQKGNPSPDKNTKK